MKFWNHSLFLIIALALFFPLGLIFLIISEKSHGKKWLFAGIGAILFAAILSLTFLNQPKVKEINDFQIHLTRQALTVGQSGGFIVESDDQIISDFSVSATSDLISINKNVYTAQKIGKTSITISVGKIEKSIEINIVPGTATNQTIYFTPTGKRYHKSATHAGNNSVSATEEEAIQSGKTPCLVCYKKKAP